jgi:hypothetical protein
MGSAGPPFVAGLSWGLEGLAVALSVVLAAVHVVVARFCITEGGPRTRFLSVAGGVSVAYVFVHILPELQAGATTLEEQTAVVSAVFERHIYLVALLGFVVFYGLERFVQHEGAGVNPDEAVAVFWLHVGSFAAYNALVGYLLVHREEPGVVSLLVFATAMALHFLVNDVGLQHHREPYASRGRWVLAGGVLAGTAVGVLVDVGDVLLAALFAFLAGGIVLNTIKEELPEERDSHFWSFALGAAAYSAVLFFA